MKRALVVSIKPKYANRILDGCKQIELRKSSPKVSHNDLVIIYATAPIKAIVGYCKVREVIKDSPRKLWDSYGDVAGIERKEFNFYYKQRDYGVGILLKDVRVLKRKMNLKDIRKHWPDFNPPQSYAYLSLSDIYANLISPLRAA